MAAKHDYPIQGSVGSGVGGDVWFGSICVKPGTRKEADLTYSLLDEDTLETARYEGPDPRESLDKCKIAWFGCPADRTPLAAFGIEPIVGGAAAWLMTTVRLKDHGKDFLRAFRRIMLIEVSRHERLSGHCLISGSAPRMLTTLGATFSLPDHPKFLCWDLVANPRLRI